MPYCRHLPSRYAESKLPEMRSRWNGALGDAVRSLMPRVFPGVPDEVGIGISANSMGATEAITSAGFWEIGWYNIPAGRPNETPPEGMYRRVAQGGTVRALIGRPADVTSSWASDTLGQAAVGLVAYADVESQNVIANIPADLRPADGGSVWNVACSIMGYVSGGSAAASIRRHAAVLRSHDERTRFHALAREVAREVQDNASGINASSAAYPIVRTLQRLECGRRLALSLNRDASWWPSSPDQASVDHWLTIAYYGQPEQRDCVPPGLSPIVGLSTSTVAAPSVAAVLVPIGVGLMVFGAIGWVAWRRGLFGSASPIT